MFRFHLTGSDRPSDALIGALGVAYTVSSVAAIGVALGSLAH